MRERGSETERERSYTDHILNQSDVDLSEQKTGCYVLPAAMVNLLVNVFLI